MRRGDLITVALSGDYGKPRPAMVIQSDHLPDMESVVVCLLTTTLRDTPAFRIDIAAGPSTGLRDSSQIMVDKIMTVRRDRCGPRIGCIEPASVSALNRALAFVMGFAD